MGGSKIPNAVKRKLAGSGIGSGILPLIKQTVPEFDTRDIVLEYPEVRFYRVDITLYADSTKHPLYECCHCQRSYVLRGLPPKKQI
jgi:hypothetical protein